VEYYKTTVPDRAGEGAKVLFVGTVYSRFHYASDVVAGLAVGALAVWVTDKMDKNKF